jgi:hypothetical protein
MDKTGRWVWWVISLFAATATACGGGNDGEDVDTLSDPANGGAAAGGSAGSTFVPFASSAGGSVRQGGTDLPRFDRRRPMPAAVPSVRVEERAPRWVSGS